MVSTVRRKMRAWSRRHSYSFFSSLGALLKHRTGTLMTVIVLGIAISLPLGLFVTLKNFDRLDLRREEWGAITVFGSPDAAEPELRQLAQLVAGRDDVLGVSLVSPQQGMAEFIEASGFGQSLSLLGENPLPWVMLVNPGSADGSRGVEATESHVQALMAFLESHPVVDSVQFDYKWLQRLSRMLELGRAAAMLLSILFGLSVIVVVANTIRLDVAARAEEIEILALVGANNGFIRQPFLYSGFWYGLSGGALALGLMGLALLYLETPLERLLDAYGRGFELRGLDAVQVLVLLFASGALGLLGALISVQRYLRILAVGGSLGRR